MSDLVVITFDIETDDPAALAAIRDAQKGAGLALKDSAVVVKDVTNDLTPGTSAVFALRQSG